VASVSIVHDKDDFVYNVNESSDGIWMQQSMGIVHKNRDLVLCSRCFSVIFNLVLSNSV
jgi:hypothetical protein